MKIKQEQNYSVYILTNPERTVLYTGVMNNLIQRLIEHWVNRGNPKTFAGKYFCYNLIYYEDFPYINNAIAREKEIKGWRRQKKLDLIKTMNPDWTFLNVQICDGWPPKEIPKRF
jgi:putative endonuclease